MSRATAEPPATHHDPTPDEHRHVPIEEVFLRGRVKVLAFLIKTRRSQHMGERDSALVRFATLRKSTHLGYTSLKNHLHFLVEHELVEKECIGDVPYYKLADNQKTEVIATLFDALALQKEMGKGPFKILKVILDHVKLTFYQIKKVAKISHYYVIDHLEYLMEKGFIHEVTVDGAAVYGPNRNNPTVRRIIEILKDWE